MLLKIIILASVALLIWGPYRSSGECCEVYLTTADVLENGRQRHVGSGHLCKGHTCPHKRGSLANGVLKIDWLFILHVQVPVERH